MGYDSIDEIYAANARVRDRLKISLNGITDEQAAMQPEGEGWSIAEITEHIALVEAAMVRICGRLLRKAEEAGRTFEGKVTLSDEFFRKGAEIDRIKVEAPDIVKPVSGRSIAESLETMEQNRNNLEELRPLFEKFDGSELKFPHPFFGEICAHEWLALSGGHEKRHIRQIERVKAGF